MHSSILLLLYYSVILKINNKLNYKGYQDYLCIIFLNPEESQKHSRCSINVKFVN